MMGSSLTSSNLPYDFDDDPDSVIMVGGVDLQSLDPDVPGRCVFKLIPSATDPTERWQEMASLDEYTHHHAVAVLKGKLYVIGGFLHSIICFSMFKIS